MCSSDLFVQIILGRIALPSWVDMWAILRPEEIRRITKRQNSSNGMVRAKKEEEDDATLASKERKQ